MKVKTAEGLRSRALVNRVLEEKASSSEKKGVSAGGYGKSAKDQTAASSRETQGENVQPGSESSHQLLQDMAATIKDLKEELADLKAERPRKKDRESSADLPKKA